MPGGRPAALKPPIGFAYRSLFSNKTVETKQEPCASEHNRTVKTVKKVLDGIVDDVVKHASYDVHLPDHDQQPIVDLTMSSEQQQQEPPNGRVLQPIAGSQPAALQSCQGSPEHGVPAKKKPRLQKRDWQQDAANRKFHPNWSLEMDWLHYDEENDVAFCAPCKAAGKRGIGAGTNVMKKQNFLDHQVNWRPFMHAVKSSKLVTALTDHLTASQTSVGHKESARLYAAKGLEEAMSATLPDADLRSVVAASLSHGQQQKILQIRAIVHSMNLGRPMTE